LGNIERAGERERERFNEKGCSNREC
jgi:hypothetical protein